MSSILLKNAAVFASDALAENASILVSDGVIADISSQERPGNADREIDAAGLSVFPGFVDVHIHGAVGVDVNAADADGLVEIARFLVSNGVTAWMPTLVPDSDENYRRVIDAIDRLMEMQTREPIAQAVGVHYEGVFANEKMCGALRPEYFKSGQWAVGGGQLPRLRSGVHMTTLAPEVDGGIELIKALVDEGWIVSIGHTGADAATLDAAAASGARHLTHFFNAMTGIHHRDVGVAGWGLTNKAVTFDIIADGVHVHPKMLQLACGMKSVEQVSLISDSVAPTGLGDGEYEIWGEKVTVKDGRTRNERGSIAGSVITMQDAFARMRSLGFSAGDVSRMASENPAHLLGLADARGSIQAGKRADLVGVDADGVIRLVMVGGDLVDL